MLTDQQLRDQKNAEFRSELCGSSLARSLGITEINAEAFRQFDQAYLEYYPYLASYVTNEKLKDRRVLEIGLGYGTLGNLFALQGSDYYGIDIAEGPVRVIKYRLELLGQTSSLEGHEGSALALPYPDASFDYVYSIGCLHHTGNLSRSVSEVHRVLKPGGKATIMLYNRHSFRQLVDVSLMNVKNRSFFANRRVGAEERIWALYDTNAKGEAAPHTDYVSRAEVNPFFKKFSHLQIDVHNFDPYKIWKEKLVIRRKWLLNNVARVLGLDFYIVATK